ncbi:COL6A [Mytilus coruscus]|uniref:COL6A n=1 Tax=Mytilus coruscus TaxID=42192 RepID=A0A6J8EQ33_MYTCO|nr:COL6A [Mytilus coruscus]
MYFTDIVFLIDTSSSISQTEFERSIDFVYNITNFLKIGTQDVQISVVLYDKKPIGVFDFDTYLTKQSLLNAIKNIHKGIGASTNTAIALDYSRALFNFQNGSRNNAEKVVVTLTDGDSNDQISTKHAADLLRKNNITVYGVGVGHFHNGSEIFNIAGESANVYTVGGFEYICNLVPIMVPVLDPSATHHIVNNCPQEPSTTPYSTTILATNYSTKTASEDKGKTGVIAGVTASISLLSLLLLFLVLRRKCSRKRKIESPPNDIIIGQAPRKTTFIK